SNLLDGIGNGVQVLQAANTGITSLSKLVDTAKSIANQALQTTVGYSTKSNVSATISGAVATDLRGTTSFTSATAASNVITDGTGNSNVYIGTTAAPTATVQDLANAIDLASGVKKTVNTAGVAALATSSGTVAAIAAGVLTLTTGTGADLSITGKADLLK